MAKRKKHSDITLGSIIGAIIFAIIMAFLIVFAIYYDPNKEFSNSFFDDVSKAIKWQ